MKDSDIFDLIQKKSSDQLSNEELLFLKHNLNDEEIEQYSAIINNFKELDGETSLPHDSIKESLLSRFKAENIGNKSNMGNGFKFLEIAATATIILGLSYTFYLLFNQKSQEKVTQICPEDFNKFTQIEDNFKQEEVQSREKDTKYLMNMDFFTNSYLAH